MVVVEAYAPDAQYDEGSTEGNYSQRLGERAKASGKGVTADKWKPRSVPPKPTVEQVKHPKRLLWADLEMHLRHHAYCTRETSAPRGARLGGLRVFFVGLEARWPNIRLVRKKTCRAKKYAVRSWVLKKMFYEPVFLNSQNEPPSLRSVSPLHGLFAGTCSPAPVR